LSSTGAVSDKLDIRQAADAVGVRPETTLRLMQLARDENAHARDLEQIIDADPSMAIRTLKLANSAFYGMRSRVARLDRAITMLGVTTWAQMQEGFLTALARIPGDPWFVASQKRMYPTCKLSRAIEGVCEKRIMQRAKVIVTNTQRLCRTFKEAYPGVHAEKIVHIPNGISKTAFQALDGLPKFDQFTMTYAGSLYFYRTPEPIFRAVRELIDARRVKAADLRIKLIGNCSHVDGFPTADIIASYGLDGIVDVLPPIPYQEVLKVLKKSQLALLFAPDQPYQIPAKVYDYIGTGTKILAIANEGATSELIDATASGKSFLPEDISGIREYIAEGVQAGMINGWTIDRHPELLDAYDYSNITHRLAKVLTEKC